MLASQMIAVNGYPLHMLTAGDGPPVLLLHGFAGSADDWRPTVELLGRSGYQAIAVDALGFGRSDKPGDAPYSFQLYADLYAGLLDRLGLAQAALVGHSMGGKYAVATALLHPQRVSRLALVASDGFTAPSPMAKAGGWPLLGALALTFSAQPSVVRAMLEAAFHDPATFVTADLVARGQAALSGADNRRALLALSRQYAATDLQQTGLRTRLHELRQPTLIIWGAEDRIFGIECGRAAQREIPGAQLVCLPGCGHVPQVEATRAFHGLLLGFLAAGDSYHQPV